MSQAIDVVVGNFSVVKQPAKGSAPDFTATARPADKPAWSGGFLDPAKTLGESDYFDGRRYGSPKTFTKQVAGDVGDVEMLGEPSNTHIHLAFVLANDTVTGSSDPYTHTSTSDSNAAKPYLAFAQGVGSAVAAQRQVFSDAQYGGVTITSTQADQNLKLSMPVKALKAGAIYTTAPAKAENGETPFLHSESEGNLTIDGVVTYEASEAVTTVDDKLEAWFGNALTPCQITVGQGLITCSVKSIATDDNAALRNKVIYGTATPAAGAVPVKDVYMCAVNRKYVRSASRSLEIQHPNVAVDPADLKIAPQSAGGATEITVGGKCLRIGAPAMTVISKTGDAAAYV